MGSWPHCWLLWVMGQHCCKAAMLLYGWKQLGSAICSWTHTHKFQCQTNRGMEALQPPLNNTKTNCFSFSHWSNMHETNWQWDQIASFSLLLLPYHLHPPWKKIMVKAQHNTTVESQQAMWLQAENVSSCFLSEWAILHGAACAGSLVWSMFRSQT